MKVLIVGGSERERAIAWKISQGPKVEKLYYASDNAGITKAAKCADIGVMDFEKLVAFAGEQAIDLVVVGPDDPLAADAVDAFEDAGIRVFGPGRNAAILETSKAFSKDLMKKYDIPSAACETFDSPEEALAYLETAPMPIVLKTNGLALGKNVLVCNTREEAKEDVKILTLDRRFGSAGNRIVIKEFMTGREASVLSFVGGHTIKIMTSTQDHKRAEDEDQGLDTGGMGTFSPSPFYTDEVDAFHRKYVYQPAVGAMKVGGREFKGIIFFDLMLTGSGPKMLEYNAKLGDPRTQVVLPRIKNDIANTFETHVDGTLDQIELEFKDNAVMYAVLTSDGYPKHYERGCEVDGLSRFDGQGGCYVFHAGNKLDKDGNVVTSDGGMLGIAAGSNTLEEVGENAYRVVEWVEFGNKYMRHDIRKAIDEA